MPGGELLWTPSAERVEPAWLTRYQRWLEPRVGRTFASYAELHAWSVAELETFWRSIWDFFDVTVRRSPSWRGARCRARSGSRTRA
jgi:acetoacetyl-CoA synthetase